MPDFRIPGLPAKPSGTPLGPDWLFAVWCPDDDTTYKIPYSEVQLAAIASNFFPSLANAFADGQPAFATAEEAVVWLLRNRASNTGQTSIGSAPSVAISANPPTLKAGQDVEFTVLAIPSSGTNIAKVEIRNGTQLLYTFPAGTSSFKWVWKSVAEGNYSIQAVATDGDGKVGKSNIIALLVSSATGTPTTGGGDTTNPGTGTGIKPPAPTNPEVDDDGNTFTYNPGLIKPTAPTGAQADDTNNNLTYTPGN
jgi:hypothetical protein